MRRILKRIAAGVALLVLAVIGLVWSIVFTDTGTRLALEQGLAIYGDMIPGHASVDSVEGSIADGITLHGVRLADRHDQPLVEAATLRLRVDPWRAAARTIDTGTIRIEALRVYALAYEDGGFADLGPEGPAEEGPPSPYVGPELPVEIVGRLELVDAIVLTGSPSSPQETLVVPELAVDLRAGGLQARAGVVGRVSIPAEDLEVFHLELDAEWSGPAAHVESLLVQSNAADIVLESAHVDFAKEAFGLERLRVIPDAQWLADRAALPTGAAVVELRGAGATDDFSLDLDATLANAGSVAVSIAGALAPEPDLHAWIDAGLDEAEAIGVPDLPALHVDAWVDAAGDPATGTVAALRVQCHGCTDALGPLVVEADGFAGGGAQWGHASAHVSAADVRLDLDAAIDPQGVGGVMSQLRIPSLGALAPILDRFAPGLGLAGALEVDLACAGMIDPRTGMCRVQVDLERGAPVRRIVLDASAATSGPGAFLVAIGELIAEARDARVALARPHARVRYGPEGLAVDDFAVRVATKTGAGGVEMSGTLSLAEPREADARVRVRNLSLSAVDAFVPDLRARGRLNASLDMRGTMAAPELAVSIAGQGLGVRDIVVGDVDIDASYRAGVARASLDVEHGELGRARLRADAPIDLDLAAGAFGLRARDRMRVDLDVDDVPLAAARRFAAGVDTLEGELALHAKLRGTLQRPTIETELDVTHPRWDGKPLPELDLSARYERAAVTATLAATHPTAFERLTLDANVPVALDLVHGRARWHSDRDHGIDLVVEGARVQEVQAWAPSLVADGRVDLELVVRGSMHAPKVDAELHASDLAYANDAIGDVAASLRYADAKAAVQLHASGPAFGGVGVDAEVPVTIAPADATFAWHPEREHRVHVSLNDLLVREALRFVPAAPGEAARPIAASGRLDAELDVKGPATAPVVTLDTALADGTYAHREVGRIGVNARYEEGRVHATVDWEKSPRHTAHVDADVPVVVDLPGGRVEWDRMAKHHLAIDVPRIDGELLAPFVDTGDFDATLALKVEGDGNAEAFDLDASVDGTLAGGDKRHPIRVRLDASQNSQSLAVSLGPRNAPWGTIDARTELPVFDVIGGADWKATPLRVHTDILALDLRTMDGFMPLEVQGLTGVLMAKATVDGTLGAPKLDGRIAVRNGAATIVPARQRIEKLEIVATLTNDAVKVPTLRFTAGGGTVTGHGGVTLREGAGLQGAIDLDIDDVPVRSPGLPRMKVSSKVATKVAMGLDDLGIEVRLAETKVDVYTSSITAGKPIPTNDKVRFVDFDTPASEREPGPRDDPEAPPARRTRFALVLTEPLRIVGPAVDMAWKGKIETDGAAASGALTADKGYFDLLGNDFDIEQGTVTLPDDGSNMPFVDVVARTTVDDVQITATVRGKLPKPELVLSSSPSMTQSEIFTVLVTGSADTESADPDEVEAKAASVLAATSNPALQRQINEKLHVDRVGVSFGESTEQPILSAGKNVSKKVYVETQYHHNAPRRQNRAELRVEYRFATRWSVETFFGDAAAGGVDLFWGRAFDSKRKRERKRED